MMKVRGAISTQHVDRRISWHWAVELRQRRSRDAAGRDWFTDLLMRPLQ
jgi:hypothetical protein